MQPDLLTVPNFPRASDYAGVWALEPTAASAMWDRARRMNLAAHVAAAESPKLKAESQTIANDKGVTIAAVMLTGVLTKATSSMDAGTSTVEARRSIRKAAADPDVGAILLMIDSPGGSVAGTADLAADVKAASAKKPVYAFIDDLGASAAYWIASQADAVFANDRTAMIGSIGTLAVLYDLSGAAEQAGIKALVFGTGPLKGAGAPGAPVTDEQQAYYGGLVRDSQVSFDAAVKKGRGLTEAKLTEAKTGGVFLAADALALGLIDGIKSFDAVVSELAVEARKRGKSGSSTRAESPVPIRSATMNENDTATVATDAADPVAKMRADAAAEFTRIAGIQAKAGKHPAIAAEAIAQNWSIEKTELAAMRADLPTGVGPGNPSGRRAAGGDSDKLQAMIAESAICMTAGVRAERVALSLPSAVREQVMNEATSPANRGYGIHSLMDAAIAAAGLHYHGNRKSNEYIRKAFEADTILKAQGFSTVGLSNILGNTANKVMNETYGAQGTTWREIAAVRSHSNFHAYTRVRLDSTGAFRKVGPDGELKHIGLADSAYTNQLATYGAIIVLTRQMMINDDLSAFTELPMIFGRMAALRIEEAVYVTLLSNPSSFFASGNNNLVSGAGSALSAAALTTSETKFADQVDSNGKPILTVADRILVGTALKVTADILYSDATLVTTGGTGIYQTQNPNAGKYRPIVSPYLNNTAIKDQDGIAITGQSATLWYQFANPAVRAAMAVAFLNGNESPTIESSETEFQTLGMQWRAFHDFGVGMEDTTAAVKNAGA